MQSNRISGFSYKFSNFSNQPSKRQGKKYQTRMFKSFSKSIDNNPRLSKATRQAKCLNSSSIPCTAALSISPSSQKTKLGQTRELRSPSNLVTSSSRRTEMVARSSSSMEWESSTSLVLSSLAFDLWQWCLERSITVLAQHLPGCLNITPDYESWANPDYSDWQLDPLVFQQLNKKWGPVVIDLFATRLSQLPKFVSCKPDPVAEAVDAFTLD